MKQLSILVKDRIGLLAEIAEILGSHNINVSSIAAEKLDDKALIRLVTDNNTLAKQKLEEEKFNVIESDVLIARLNDRPGELAKLASRLSEAKVNIENIMLLSKQNGKAIYAVQVDQPDVAEKII
jgi:hypothetical protein